LTPVVTNRTLPAVRWNLSCGTWQISWTHHGP
jgi:hypothetical protein